MDGMPAPKAAAARAHRSSFEHLAGGRLDSGDNSHAASELASGNHSFFMSLFFCLPPWKSVMFPKYNCAIRFERATDAEPI